MGKKRIELVLALATIALGTAAGCSQTRDEPELTHQQAIAILKEKEFRPVRVNNQLTLQLVDSTLSKTLAQKRSKERGRVYEEMVRRSSGQPRDENIAPYDRSYETAKLGTNHAVALAGTPLILAILGYPWDADSGPDYVFTLFDKHNTTNPRCLSIVNLMVDAEDEGYYYWGNLRSMDVRPAGAEGYFIQTNLSGADAGDAWDSPMFMHIDKQCKITMLAKFYELADYGGEENECSGKTLSGHFVSDSQIELITQNVSCHPKTKEPVLRLHKKQAYDLNSLLQDPKRRIFQP